MAIVASPQDGLLAQAFPPITGQTVTNQPMRYQNPGILTTVVVPEDVLVVRHLCHHQLNVHYPVLPQKQTSTTTTIFSTKETVSESLRTHG